MKNALLKLPKIFKGILCTRYNLCQHSVTKRQHRDEKWEMEELKIKVSDYIRKENFILQNLEKQQSMLFKRA